jgi:hypothetical protein
MKVIGIMCVRDEADLLPEVLEHLDGELDALYAYDDGSIDDTQKILRSHPTVDYLMTREADTERLPISRPHYHHLLEQIKKDYADCAEPVWIVITMGDRFFLNKMPRQIAFSAEAGGFTTVHGVQLDFLRHQLDPWTEENDRFPRYLESLRKTCKWFKWDENCVIAYKLSTDRSYLEAKYPWPRGGHTKEQYKVGKEGKLTIDMPFVEHQGRRSPNALKWRIESGSRKLSSKINLPVVSFEAIMEVQKKFYQSWKVLPWVDNDSLIPFLEMINNPDYIYNAFKRSHFEPVMADIEANGPHRRADV